MSAGSEMIWGDLYGFPGFLGVQEQLGAAKEAQGGSGRLRKTPGAAQK